MLELGARRLGDFEGLPVNIDGSTERKSDKTCSDGIIGQLIDKDKCAQPFVLDIGRNGTGRGRSSL